MNRACSICANKGVAAALGYLLLAKAVLSAVSVVKADRVQGTEPLHTVYEEKECFCGY